MILSHGPHIHNVHMNWTELSLRTDALANKYINCVLYFDQKYIICVTGERTALICKNRFYMLSEAFLTPYLIFKCLK